MIDPKQLVEQGYDRMAEGYLASKGEDDHVMLSALEGLARKLPPGAAVLDLGCGAGVPVTRFLAERGFAVTGVDISARQLELAHQHVPNATFIKADMAALNFPPGTFDAVVSFYAIIHLPRAEQPALIARIHSWLKPGGSFLGTWGVSEWEGREENWEGWGAPMWWSHYGKDQNLDMLRSAGFEIISAEVREDKETWLWVLARRGREYRPDVLAPAMKHSIPWPLRVRYIGSFLVLIGALLWQWGLFTWVTPEDLARPPLPFNGIIGFMHLAPLFCLALLLVAFLGLAWAATTKASFKPERFSWATWWDIPLLGFIIGLGVAWLSILSVYNMGTQADFFLTPIQYKRLDLAFWLFPIAWFAAVLIRFVPLGRKAVTGDR